MFKKQFRVKSNSQLKGSDRKRIKTEILNNFPNVKEEILNDVIPNKETMFLVKVITHSEQIVTIYCVQKLPIIFQIDNEMYPTVYMLWHIPDLLYSFTTHPEVLPIIVGGADLMLPGLVLPNGPSLNAYGKLEKGAKVSINLTSNRAPIAVGRTALSSHDMYMSGKYGKCVQVLHFYGDQLSCFGLKLVLPELGPAFTKPDIPEEVTKEEAAAILCTNLENNKLNDCLYMPDDIESSMDSRLENSPITANICDINESQNPEDEMDELILYCFLKALKTSMKKVDLPLLTSNFYKLHMLSACPSSKSIELKKSSYKKLSKFLDQMVEIGIIKLQTVSKGVISISEINLSNDLIRDFVDPWINNEDCTKPTVDTSSKNPIPEVVENYTVTAAVLPLFEKYAYKKKDALSLTVVRKAITDYIRTQHLQDPTNKKNVLLDDLLRSVTGESSDTSSLSWDQMISKLLGRMGQAYKVELGTTESILNKGKLQPINITIGTRSGNKKVTLVDNLELYRINIQEFCKECQHGVAASTTVNSFPNMKSVQVQIQGNQTIFVGNLLTGKYSIPKKYIRGLENAPKRKK